MHWTDMRYAVWKEVTNCDTCQRTKRSKEKYGKLPAKLAEEIPRNKLFVDLIGPYVIIRKVNKENLHLKAVTMINPLTGWFEIAQHEGKSNINRKISWNYVAV